MPIYSSQSIVNIDLMYPYKIHWKEYLDIVYEHKILRK